MVFDEYYGRLPKNTLRLIKKYNVSPADFDLMTDILGNGDWPDINQHIVDNSTGGYYQPRFY